MKFDLSNITLNKYAISKGITLPSELTEELAEFIGIMVGDGHLGYFPSSDMKKPNKFDLNISGNKKENEYLFYIMNLFNSLFNFALNYHQDSKSNSIMLRNQCRTIVEFVNQICEIPLNKKTDIVRIPKLIMNSNEKHKCAFLRGLADTDFSLTYQNRTGKGHNYPVIKGTFKSKNLIKDLEVLFSELGFRHCVYYDDIRPDNRFDPVTMHNIYLYGRDNLRKWLCKVGFSNAKYHRKINKWKKNGICPPGY